MVKFFNVFLFLWVVSMGNIVLAQDLMEWRQLTNGQLHLSKVLLDNKGSIIAVGRNTLIKSGNNGKNWTIEKINGVGIIKKIYLDKKNCENIYLISEKGLFLYSFKKNQLINLIKEKKCTSFAQGKNEFFLGTEFGVWIGTPKMDSWIKLSGQLGKIKVCDIREMDEFFYFVTEDKIIQYSEKDNRTDTIFDKFLLSESEGDGEVLDPENTGLRDKINCFIIDLVTKNSYVSIGEKVYFTDNKKEKWEIKISSRLLGEKINHLVIGKDNFLYAITSNLIFKYTDQWEELVSLGNLDSIDDIQQDDKNNFYIVTLKGLFKLENKEKIVNNNNFLQQYFQGEPSIEKLQHIAIEYAEVNIDKIRKWRKEIKKKAWLPNVSVGANRSTTDLWHWESGSTTKTDDDTLRKGKDSVDWDIRVSWNFGDVFWNNDQTSIDTRSKLLVELRQEILDELNRVYFERVRLRAELDKLSLLEAEKRFEKELKIKELTASLDGLTGGEFSKCLKGG